MRKQKHVYLLQKRILNPGLGGGVWVLVFWLLLQRLKHVLGRPVYVPLPCLTLQFGEWPVLHNHSTLRRNALAHCRCAMLSQSLCPGLFAPLFAQSLLPHGIHYPSFHPNADHSPRGLSKDVVVEWVSVPIAQDDTSWASGPSQ